MSDHEQSRTTGKHFRRALGAIGVFTALTALGACSNSLSLPSPSDSTSVASEANSANDSKLTLNEWENDKPGRVAVASGFAAAQETVPSICLAVGNSTTQAEAAGRVTKASADAGMTEAQALALLAMATDHACHALWESLPAGP